LVTVIDLGFPITGLPVNIEGETCRTSDGGKTDGSSGPSSVASDYISTISAIIIGFQTEIFLG